MMYIYFFLGTNIRERRGPASWTGRRPCRIRWSCWPLPFASRSSPWSSATTPSSRWPAPSANASMSVSQTKKERKKERKKEQDENGSLSLSLCPCCATRVNNDTLLSVLFAYSRTLVWDIYTRSSVTNTARHGAKDRLPLYHKMKLVNRNTDGPDVYCLLMKPVSMPNLSRLT